MLLFSFVLYVFVTSFTPGPNNIISMSNASRFGLKATFRFIFGVTVGFFLLMLLCSYFNLVLYQLIPKIKLALSILGSLYMLYLAYKTAMPSGKKSANYDQSSTFMTGLILQFINPKGILYGITVVSAFIIPFYQSGWVLTLFSLLLALVGFMSTLSWALFGALFQKFLSRHERIFNLCMGLLLVYCAFSVYL
ncbi:LysE family transporter [Paenibacillus terreus]|uniref:LysE family transporter n=1 Tax=Paenibacillus terreus TaxID=1387834 RepID=A0ABV5B8A4_9BACL